MLGREPSWITLLFHPENGSALYPLPFLFSGY